ncbi:MAG: NTP transferase domain-containing protein [Steroidobacteraceae bacterium]
MYRVVIPARYASTRLPGKPLVKLKGRPLIQWVYERARRSRAAEVLVATDDERIAEAATACGAPVVMTSIVHASGTDRIAEVAAQRGWEDAEVVVNLQGDEPLMPEALIDQAAGLLERPRGRRHRHASRRASARSRPTWIRTSSRWSPAPRSVRCTSRARPFPGTAMPRRPASPASAPTATRAGTSASTPTAAGRCGAWRRSRPRRSSSSRSSSSCGRSSTASTSASPTRACCPARTSIRPRTWRAEALLAD